MKMYKDYKNGIIIKLKIMLRLEKCKQYSVNLQLA